MIDNNSKGIWEKIRNGDHVSTKELTLVYNQMLEAMPFLSSYPEGLPVLKLARLDIATIADILKARSEQESTNSKWYFSFHC